MSANIATHEMKVKLVCDLAAICRKVADTSSVPDDLRATAHELVVEFDTLSPVLGKGHPEEHAGNEALLTKMSRFLPSLIEFKRGAQIAPQSNRPHGAPSQN